MMSLCLKFWTLLSGALVSVFLCKAPWCFEFNMGVSCMPFVGMLLSFLNLSLVSRWVIINTYAIMFSKMKASFGFSWGRGGLQNSPHKSKHNMLNNASSFYAECSCCRVYFVVWYDIVLYLFFWLLMLFKWHLLNRQGPWKAPRCFQEDLRRICSRGISKSIRSSASDEASAAR